MKKYQKDNRSTLWTIIILIIIIGTGTLLRFYQIGRLSFWLDEAVQFTYSGGNFTNLLSSIRLDPNMSLYHILAFLWIRAFPNASDGTLRALSALISVCCIPVVFQLGKGMTKDRSKANAIGLISCLLFTFNAITIEYAQEFRSYSLTFLLTSLSTLFFIRAISESDLKTRPLIWYVITSSAAVYSHLFSVFLVATQVITVLLLLIKTKQWSTRYMGFFYSYLIFLALITPIGILGYIRGPEELSWISKPSFGNIKTLLILLTGNQGKELFILYFSFACIGLFFRERLGFPKDSITRWKYFIMASCLFLPVIFALAFSITIVPIFIPKYVLFVTPYLAVIVATGIVSGACGGWKNERFRQYVTPFFLAFFVLYGVLTTMGINSFFENRQKTDWRTATQFLTEKCSESLRLYYATYIDSSVLYYNPALISQKKDWWISIVESNLNSDQLSSIFPNDHDQVCLIISHSANQQKQETIQTGIRKILPNCSINNFFEVEIDICNRK